jgi:hypothetical protein
MTLFIIKGAKAIVLDAVLAAVIIVPGEVLVMPVANFLASPPLPMAEL